MALTVNFMASEVEVNCVESYSLCRIYKNWRECQNFYDKQGFAKLMGFEALHDLLMTSEVNSDLRLEIY